MHESHFYVVVLELMSFSKFQNSPRLLFSLEVAFERALSFLFLGRRAPGECSGFVFVSGTCQGVLTTEQGSVALSER